MIPPYQPVVQNTEVFLNLYFFNGLAWAWVRVSNIIVTDISSLSASSSLGKFVHP
jgi:hypothetical protein